MWRDLVCSLLTTIARISHDERGASAMMVAMALPSLIGFGALGAETGLWYTIKLRNQSAADAAAISAAYEVIAGKTNIAGELTSAASEAATQNGYTGTTPAVIYPYNDNVVSNGVAVTLQQTQGALLASMFQSRVTIATKAVAVIEVLDHSCILALGTSGTDVEVSDFSRLYMPDCSVAANSTSRSAIDLRGNGSSIAAATLVTPGEVSLQGNPIDPSAPPPGFSLTSRPLIGAPPSTDPYASTLTHALLTSHLPLRSTTGSPWKGVTTIKHGLYNEGMSFQPNAVIDMTPGVYYVTNGDFSVASGATVTCKTCSGGNGVTIILTNTGATGGTVGNVHISNGATVSLQAPNSGTFSGLLFVQDQLAARGGTLPDNAFEGGSRMKLTGLLYFPSSTVGFHGNLSATCTLLITNQVVIDGDSKFTSAGCVSGGLTKIPAVNTVALAE